VRDFGTTPPRGATPKPTATPVLLSLARRAAPTRPGGQRGDAVGDGALERLERAMAEPMGTCLGDRAPSREVPTLAEEPETQFRQHALRLDAERYRVPERRNRLAETLGADVRCAQAGIGVGRERCANCILHGQAQTLIGGLLIAAIEQRTAEQSQPFAEDTA